MADSQSEYDEDLERIVWTTATHDHHRQQTEALAHQYRMSDGHNYVVANVPSTPPERWPHDNRLHRNLYNNDYIREVEVVDTDGCPFPSSYGSTQGSRAMLPPNPPWFTPNYRHAGLIAYKRAEDADFDRVNKMAYYREPNVQRWIPDHLRPQFPHVFHFSEEMELYLNYIDGLIEDALYSEDDHVAASLLHIRTYAVDIRNLFNKSKPGQFYEFHQQTSEIIKQIDEEREKRNFSQAVETLLYIKSLSEFLRYFVNIWLDYKHMSDANVPGTSLLPPPPPPRQSVPPPPPPPRHRDVPPQLLFGEYMPPDTPIKERLLYPAQDPRPPAPQF